MSASPIYEHSKLASTESLDLGEFPTKTDEVVVEAVEQLECGLTSQELYSARLANRSSPVLLILASIVTYGIGTWSSRKQKGEPKSTPIQDLSLSIAAPYNE